MRKFLAFAYGLAIIGGVLQKGNFQDVTSPLPPADSDEVGEALINKVVATTAQKQSEETWQEASDIQQILSQTRNANRPSSSVDMGLFERFTGGAAMLATFIVGLIRFGLQIARVSFQMLFQGLFASSHNEGLSQTMQNHMRVLRGLIEGAIFLLTNMIRESITRFIPSSLQNLG